MLLSIYAYNFPLSSFLLFFTGYCSDLFAGHLSTPPPKGVIGYNGEAGYRRNTFDLRRRPSVFGDCEEGACTIQMLSCDLPVDMPIMQLVIRGI